MWGEKYSNVSLGTSYMDKIDPYYVPGQKIYYIRAIGDRTLTAFNRRQRKMQEAWDHLVVQAKEIVDFQGNPITDQLKNTGTLDAEGGIIGSSGTPNTLDVDIPGALWNYRLVYYDHSHGVHNPTYVKALLTNTIASLP